ncbi:MAG TPA: hypothetical protein VFL90_16830 [Methylomirabilota bacterium]|nr:hypothetical protein [Methylomirabilota bacterium]
MELQLVEELSGVGIVFLGRHPIGQVHYEIRVYREASRSGVPVVGALEDIRGRLDGLDFSQLRDQQVVLRLADGRAWECAVTSDGRAYDTGRGLTPSYGGQM